MGRVVQHERLPGTVPRAYLPLATAPPRISFEKVMRRRSKRTIAELPLGAMHRHQAALAAAALVPIEGRNCMNWYSMDSQVVND